MSDLSRLVALTKNIRVLYVEDDTVIRLNIYELLSNLFKEVITAEDGDKALDLYRSSDFDILITDIKMPKMNGIELIKEIQKIIITTAHDEKEFHDEFKRLDVQYVLQKPITFTSLKETLFSVTQ